MNSTPITTRRFVRFSVAAAALAVLLAAAEAALAQSTFDWLTFSGSFQEPNNWLTESGGSENPAPPGPRDTAHFIGGDQLVTLATDWSIGTLNVGGFGGPNATYALEFEMNGRVLTGSILAFGNTVEPTKLILTDGTLFTPAGSGFGPVTNANLTLNLDRATFASTGYTDMATGTASSVYVTVRNGSSYSAGGTQGSYIGNVGAATVTVDGDGSSFALGANSQIGTSWSGAITIQNDGALSTTGVLTLATNANSSGAVTLTNSGSSWTHTDGFISTGGGTAANISINPGTMMTVTGTSAAAGIMLGNHAVLTDAGTLNVSGVGNSGITINSGGALAVNSLGSATVSGGITVNGGGMLTVNALGSVTTRIEQRQR